MTTLREAAQQALEALGNAEYGDYDAKELNEAITTLRAALAEPACCCGEPTAAGVVHRRNGPCYMAEPVQEPVAWMDIDSEGNRLSVRQWSDGNRDEVPLYTAPPQRKENNDE